MLIVPTVTNAEGNVLAPYYKVLEEINEELGTDYTFPSEKQMSECGESYADLIEFYSSMSLIEFENYVRDAHNNELQIKDTNSSDMVVNDNNIIPYAYSKTQRYKYDSKNSSNYLYITSTLYSADGIERYSKINSYGQSHSSYPYYSPSSMSSSFGTGNKTVTCTFSCSKYIAKNLISATAYKIKVTFSAADGDVSVGTLV